ncbi:MAG: DUF4160 domain-containing protein [Candidatus Hydrogenedentes bacterium]|nr:DUF4160 domain-containing protein [Candidatus Hydrogenedentota bacterium]
MPRISEFFGVAIYMYYRDHLPPHFHDIYGQFDAAVGIDRIEIIAGTLPRRLQSLVFEWARLYQKELRANWGLTRRRLPLRRIPPLE